MEQLQIFNNPVFGHVRTVSLSNKTFFVAKDVANALGYSNPRDAIARHCKGVVKHDSFKDGGQEISLIPEGDIYRLVVKSHMPYAEQFESWIFDEIVPSIRKHGMYATDELLDNPDLLIQVATALKEEREKNKLLHNENARMKPKEIFADAVSASHTSILVGDLAKILKQNNVDIGANRLFDWLRENGYLIKRKGVDWNMPTQYSMDLELLEVKESTGVNPDGSVRINKTTKVTGKGQQYFVNKLLRK